MLAHHQALTDYQYALNPVPVKCARSASSSSRSWSRPVITLTDYQYTPKPVTLTDYQYTPKPVPIGPPAPGQIELELTAAVSTMIVSIETVMPGFTDGELP